MTGGRSRARLGVRLIKYRRKEEDLTYRVLSPLREGKPVVLAVTDPRMMKVSRKRDVPLRLFLVPTEVFGSHKGGLVVSLETKGCEVLDIATGLKSTNFVRVGLTITLAVVLASALRSVLLGGF